MAEVFFDNPPILNGTEENKLRQLYSYLGIMSEKLNTALMNVSMEQLAPETRTVIMESGEKPAAENFEQLKSIIIKTANIVRTEMDEIRTTLEGQITAVSGDIGTYTQKLTNDITINANGVQQLMDRVETIETVDASGRLQSLERKVNGYIYTGWIEDEQAFGMAIGDDGITIDENTMDRTKRIATFTTNGMKFYVGAGQPVAYFDANKFYIANGQVTQTMKMGDYTWRVFGSTTLGIALVAD